MSGESIFSGVLSDENAHTELLCNLLRRSDAFLELFYQFVTGKRLPHQKPTILSQFYAGDDGRPDILLDFGDTSSNIIVEVKTRSNCRTTPPQRDGPGKAGYGNRGTAYFLVPGDWKHRGDIASNKMRMWKKLATELNKAADLMGDVVLHEYQAMLDLEYPSIRFSESERNEMAMSDPQVFVAAAIKLHRVIDSLGSRFRNHIILGQKLTTLFERTETEYGYYVKSKTTGLNLLWFGMWSDRKLLLGASYRKEWHPSRSLPGFFPAGNDDCALSLNDLVLNEAEQAVQSAFERLESILETMLLN
jgi:hypothetical protein